MRQKLHVSNMYKLGPIYDNNYTTNHYENRSK